MSQQDILEKLLKDMESVKQNLRRLESQGPLYWIQNISPVYNLTSNANDFPVTDYDTLYINPTANRTINGLTNGVKGRFLIIRNVSLNFTISFTHQNGSAIAENRIATVSTATVVLGTRQMAIFQYVTDVNVSTLGPRWFMFFPFA